MTEDGIVLNDEMDDFSTPGAVNSFGFVSQVSNYSKFRLFLYHCMSPPLTPLTQSSLENDLSPPSLP